MTNGFGNLYDPGGIDFERAIQFLFNLVHQRKRRSGITFVCYAFSRDNEFIFSTMPRDLKDKLFQASSIKKQITELETENETLDEILYSANEMTDDFQRADFDRHVNGLTLKELHEVAFNGFHIHLINGKVLTIRKGKKSISIYDIFGFFKPKSLRATVKIWLDEDIPLLDRRTNNDPDEETMKARAMFESYYVAKLAMRLNDELEKEGIRLSRYHGASAISSHWLHKFNAKDSYCAYRHRRQLSPELHKAIWQAYYGGRVEQFKIGTLKDVNIYDINSAYAFACSFLPVLLKKPTFVSEWSDKPFSLWFCEYDFSRLNPYLGYLPHRDAYNFTRYKMKGRGYFWQPEIIFMLANFPDCVEIKYGFDLEYEQAPFAKEIEYLYACRQRLQDTNNPLEKVFKLALASLYGKFAQHNGTARYYNLMYAGFITSFTRAQLLTAVRGYENETISFQTDAIHTSANLSVSLSGSLGEYKQTKYERVVYLDNGIYTGFDANGQTKVKTRGATTFDFDKAILEFNQTRAYSALNEFFIGHNIFTQHLFSGADYLEHYKTAKESSPLTTSRFAARVFELAGVGGDDITDAYFDSRIVTADARRESSLFRRSNFLESNFALDTIEAGRV